MSVNLVYLLILDKNLSASTEALKSISLDHFPQLKEKPAVLVEPKPAGVFQRFL